MNNNTQQQLNKYAAKGREPHEPPTLLTENVAKLNNSNNERANHT